MISFISENLGACSFFYGMICLIITGEAFRRGWDFFPCLVVTVLVTPLIGAILYAPYKDSSKGIKTENDNLAKQKAEVLKDSVGE